jgi:glutamate/tyrosine decarboxylase-like PLP-dependent enzyme
MLPDQLITTQEETLDPSDWDELRALGHTMIDDMLTYLQTVRDRPVWRSMPDEIQQTFQTPIPTDGSPAEQVYEDFKQNVLAYPMGNIHPRFWGWVMGNGTPMGVLADMLAAAVNPNMGGGDHAGNRVEMQVIDWCKQMLGYPAQASGLLVSGGSMANLVGLAVARNVKCGFDVRLEGVSTSPAILTTYGSVEMHSSIQKGIELMGLGSRSLRKIEVDQDFRIDTAALRRTIEADIKAGMKPICLVGNAGTVNTGAIDPLDELADIAAQYGMWYHVDGAFGALTYLSPDLRPGVAAITRADSLAFDLHKWVYVPFEAGCILVRDEPAHRHTFSLTPDYLQHADRGVAAGSMWFSDYGVQLTRGLRALKVWMTIKNSGIDKIGRVIRQNVEQARYLAHLIEQSPKLELLAPVSLNIVCFRYTAPGLDASQLNALNTELLIRLQESGVAVPSGTNINGAYALRCAITNHRTRREDLHILLDKVLELGDTLITT